MEKQDTNLEQQKQQVAQQQQLPQKKKIFDYLNCKDAKKNRL